jgi:hypothetical protein
MATQQHERHGFGSGSTSVAEPIKEQIRDTAAKTAETVKDAANKTGEKVKDTAALASDLAKDVANRAGDFVKDAAANVAAKTGEAASYIAQKADDATVSVGHDVKSFAGTIREKGPRQGVLGAADSVVADTLETCGHELEQGISGMAEDLTATIRKHPVPAVLIGIGVGFMIARTFSR